jgi:hypothetical protein
MTRTNVSELTALELGAVIRNDTETYSLAGEVEVPAAIEELKHRARHQLFAPGDERGPIEQRAARAVLDELEVALDVNLTAESKKPDAAPAPSGEHPHNDRILAANGFAAVRAQAMQAAAAVPPLPAIDAAIRYVKASRAQAVAQGASRTDLDGLDVELAQFDAVRKFGRSIRALNERAEARARITGTGQNGGA